MIVGDWHANYRWSGEENDSDDAFSGAYAKSEWLSR